MLNPLRIFFLVLFIVLVATMVIVQTLVPKKPFTLTTLPDSLSLKKVERPVNDLSDDLFKPVPVPGPHDWLYSRKEKKETVEQFINKKRNVPDTNRRVIYLQPIWMNDTVLLVKLKRFTERYFSMTVEIAENLNPPKDSFDFRTNPNTRKVQAHAGLLLEYLISKVPDDAFCVQAITPVDLYPEESWNYVFGYASYYDRVAVFSIARYDPLFFGKKRSEEYSADLLLRSCKVLAHETGHMFSMPHCVAFHCNMNGSNNLEEADAQPLHLCPVCLAKLKISIGFDSRKRYQLLLGYYQAEGLNKQAEWMTRRIEQFSE